MSVKPLQADRGAGNASGGTKPGGHDGYLIPVLGNAAQLKARQPELSLKWQAHMRRLCAVAFANDYRIVGFIRSEAPVKHYVLERWTK